MDDALLDEVVERLEADGTRLPAEVESLVLAACIGGDALTDATASEQVERPLRRRSDGTSPASHGALSGGAYLRSISVRGFRGIGPEATLELAPGPGLTVIAGRNGSGKSSFAEAVEVLLSGSTARFETYRVFRDGWRNCHDDARVHLAAELCVDGQAEPVSIERHWSKGAKLDNGRSSVLLGDGSATSLADLGWADAVATYRPFLARSELEAMLSGQPSNLHDRISAVLGLDELSSAVERLRARRLGINADLKAAETRRRELVADLRDVDDGRAEACLAALSATPVDFGALATIVGSGGSHDDGQLRALRRIAGLTVPTDDDVASVSAALTRAADGLDALAGSDSDRAKRTAELLEQALTLHAAHPTDAACPVCGTADVLGEAWRSHAREEVQRLRKLADAAAQAARDATDALGRAGRLAAPEPGLLAELQRSGLPVEAFVSAWDLWTALPEASADDAVTLRALAVHLDDAADPLRREAEQIRRRASDELARRDSVWLPVAERVAGWVDAGRTADAATSLMRRIEAAEGWLRKADNEMRNARLQPIADQARSIWEELRHESNVDLGAIALTGSGTSRRVAFDVAVDGARGTALGVMSQGELNALALSVFLPRATMPQSPFRFVVIDDPVQSMDPAKVAGLARVLARVAEQRQVVVFTHDERLPAAIRRLDLPARMLKVSRAPGSVVELRPDGDPVSRLLDDADAVARERHMPTEVLGVVVAGLCRDALEARFTTTAITRGLGSGRPLTAVEADLVGAKRLREKAALALFGDADRHGEVRGHVMRLGKRHAETFDVVNEAVHAGFQGDPTQLVSATRRLVAALDGSPS